MTAIPFDPFRTEARLRWRNRAARWRADPAQSAFHATAAVLLLALLVPSLGVALAEHGAALRGVVEHWPLACATLALAAMATRHAFAAAARRARHARDWLQAQPIVARIGARRERDAIALDALAHALPGFGVLGVLRADAATFTGLAACVLAAALLTPLSSRHVHATRHRAALDSRLVARGAGRIWRWQRTVAGIALRGRRLAFGAWALLLVPLGSGPGVVLALALAGLLLATLSTAWSRSVAALPQAHAWLGSQPLRGRTLLKAGSAVPLLVLGLAAGLLGATLAALGARGLAWIAPGLLVAFGTLHLGCAAAARARRRAILPLWLAQGALLLGVLQAMPPLALPCWSLQMLWLLRRAGRP